MVVLPNTFAAGKEVRRFNLRIRTTALIDLIYKVRSEFEALSNMELSRSMGYRKIQSEAGTHKDETVHFNWQNLTAGHINNGRYTAVTPIQPGTFDPLGIFYFLRTVNLNDIDHFERPVSDGKKCIVSRLVVTGKDRIRWGDSFHDTYVIRSHMKGIEGLFEKSQDSHYTLWLSADIKRTPLVIEIDMFFGTIVCRLVPPSSG